MKVRTPLARKGRNRSKKTDRLRGWERIFESDLRKMVLPLKKIETSEKYAQRGDKSPDY
jgi:hypothetical protein